MGTTVLGMGATHIRPGTPQALARVVDDAIRSAGVSNVDAAERTGIARETLSRKRKGHGKPFDAAEQQAIASATENGVIVDPLLGDGASACVRTLAEDLAQGTGGAVIDGVPSQDEIEDFLERLLSELCSVNSYCPEVPPTGQNYEDCNDNGLADTCEIPYYWNQREQPSCGDHCAEDCNENEIPDECDIASGESSDVDPQDGIPDECQRFQ